MIINPRDTYATITFVNDLTTLQAVTNVTEATLASVNDRVPNMDFIIFFVPSPKIIETYAAATGGNVLGLADRNKDLIGQKTSRCHSAAHADVRLQLPSSHHDG